MAIKNLIVLTDDSPGCAARIDTALLMAQKYDAYLTGVYFHNLELMTPKLSGLLSRSMRTTLAEEIKEFEEKAAQGARVLFQDKVQQAGWSDKADWLLARGTPNTIAGVITRYADLVIAGQTSPERRTDSSVIDVSEVVFSCGRPLFIVPQSFRLKAGLTEHAVFGWNGSREAARALADAMLILETKSLVSILTVGSLPDVHKGLKLDIAEHLKRHGIKTQTVQLSSDAGHPGLTLLSYAEQHNADFLVIGAYSRSRLREQILGGATRTILEKMTLPILMSH